MLFFPVYTQSHPGPIRSNSYTSSRPNPLGFPAPIKSFRISTCKSLTKQTLLTPMRMNTYKNPGGGVIMVNRSQELIPK
jgi:hypothetical protein